MVTMNTNKKGFKEGGNERDRRSEASKHDLHDPSIMHTQKLLVATVSVYLCR